MAAQFGANYNPSSVMMGAPAKGSSPYLPLAPAKPKPTAPAAPPPSSTTLAATANRPTGPSAGYDPAYLQNLMSYSAGQFQQPSGGFRFNPTDVNTFPGAPTGGGSAPVLGMPNTLLGQAQGGQPFSWNAPSTPIAPTPTGGPAPGSPNANVTLQQWLQQFLQGGSPWSGGGNTA
jgi:hypothetical protein